MVRRTCDDDGLEAGLDLIGGKPLEHMTVDRTYPLDQVPDAVAYVENGRAKGKVVVTHVALMAILSVFVLGHVGMVLSTGFAKNMCRMI
jgi:hypothetical protein